MRTVQSDSNNLSLFSLHFLLNYAKVSDYRMVRLLSHRTINMHPKIQRTC